MSILNKYKRWVPMLLPMKDEYWDFVLSQDGTPSIPFGRRMTERCLASYIEFGDRECQEENGVHSYKKFAWDECVSNGTILEDIGYTGIDNGLIYYGGWERVSNKEFYDIFTNSVVTIEPGDCNLHLHQVTGNTGVYSYPMEYVEGKYYTLSGGFFQGFYKLHGFDYQVLPQYIEDEWNVEITLRPRWLIQDEDTLNMTHENNEGIFFYMGTRAEDKLAQFYNTDFSGYKERAQPDRKPCDSDYFLTDQDMTMRAGYECRDNLVAGYHILSVTPTHTGPVTYPAETKAWLDAKLQALTEADPERYVILNTHPMIENTCYGSLLGTQTGEVQPRRATGIGIHRTAHSCQRPVLGLTHRWAQ